MIYTKTIAGMSDSPGFESMTFFAPALWLCSEANFRGYYSSTSSKISISWLDHGRSDIFFKLYKSILSLFISN